MTNQLAVIDFDTTQRMSMALYKSGYFSDVKSEAQAIVKVMAGQELGLPPFASMTGIHIIKGKPVLGSNVIATLVKNDPRYNFKVVRCDDQQCQIVWFENGTNIGSSFFTMKEAQAAGLAGKDNWKKYPSDMLFARAISRGARRFAPGIFGGAPVYTPDEMGADVDPDGYIDGEVVEDNGPDWGEATDDEQEPKAVTETETEPEPEPKPNGNGAKFNGQTADARAWLEDKIKDDAVPSGLVADAACMTGLYNDREHVRNALSKDFDWTSVGAHEDFTVDFRIKWTGKAALRIFDWLIDRKAQPED